MAKNKHLLDDERLQIEQLLRSGVSIKQIALRLGKSTSTISREIRAKALFSDKFPAYRIHNRCSHRLHCQRRYLCQDKPNCTKNCSKCKLCNVLCDDYQEEVCYRLSDPPYVCNGCMDEFQCVLRKKFYLHRPAQQAYRELLKESRSGANISEDELLRLDAMISPLIQHGQSVHHIVANNQDHFSLSEKTLYRYVSGGLLKAKNMDMPRVCRLKPRKSKPIQHKVDSTCRIGRTFADFHQFKSETGLCHVEMDSVIGRPGGKTLLTLLLKSCDFLLAFLRERNTSQSVIDTFNSLYTLLEPDCFNRLLPLILTDNGSEFSNPKALEWDAQGNRRTHIFYCDPCASFQKPSVELHHEFIRRILPKGSSFDALSQQDVNLMMSHINSYSREKLNDKSPFELFGFLYGFDVLEKLNLQGIPPNEITLKPSLIK